MSRSRAPRVTSIVDDETTTPNYALQLTEGLADDVADAEAGSFALRLNEALQAISSAQDGQPRAAEAVTSRRRAGVDARSVGVAARAAAGVASDDPAPSMSATSDETSSSQPLAPRGGFTGWLAALDRLPPIRLPIGPAIPWRLGLPALVALVIVMGVMSRSAAHADAPGVQLPAEQTYPVQNEAPLFAKPQPTDVPSTSAGAPSAQQPALGVQDPGGLGFDLGDMAIKLIVVLGLAYASLVLLKRVGFGGAASPTADGKPQTMRVVSSLALAPNRSVHVIKVAGGRTLLVGATPNAVNLIADLGELTDDETPEAASFFDVLKGKIGG